MTDRRSFVTLIRRDDGLTGGALWSVQTERGRRQGCSQHYNSIITRSTGSKRPVTPTSELTKQKQFRPPLNLP
eukprot:3855534-Pyramimonas_sp.AAC.1